jgi:hypothetical protein
MTAWESICEQLEPLTPQEIALIITSAPDEACVIRNGTLVRVNKAARDAALLDAVGKATRTALAALELTSADEIARNEINFKPYQNWVTVTYVLKDGRSETCKQFYDDVRLQ